ncbi:hypothetical protein CBR_g48302 [Chara braunii]|uniref:Uncharacterized protein n=1 Tax=Chara braunii TaxID=69332 RepID=A0A388K452_CHABU|nr:hypothetical protein CBR_g48302 [Chara braunii]|eukprot:GBG64834.1 hypothetical protein CBR_g48302 [Chara braunii]
MPIATVGRGRKGPNDADKRYKNRSKLYHDKLWALDWVGVAGEAGCGAVVFLTEDERATWYCCSGITRSEIDKGTAEKGKVDERDLRKFFLTSVYDEQGTDWVKTVHKVSLDLALFKGYGQKAFAMKAFGSKRDRNALRMLLPIEFLSKTNGYKKSGQFSTVAAGHQLTLPFVPFDAPDESLVGLSACSSDRRQVVWTQQQPVGGKETIISYQRRLAGGSSRNIPKKKVVAGPPSNLPVSSHASASSRSWDTSQRRMDEESDEETEDDARVRQVRSRLIATPGHIQGEGSCDVNERRQSGGGAEARVGDDGEHDEDEGECGCGEWREYIRGTVDHMEWEKDVVSGGVSCGSVGGSEMEDEELEDEGGDAGVSAGLTSKGKGKRTAQSSSTPVAPKKQAQRKAVDEARVALDASQGKLGEADVKCKSSARVRKTSQPKRPVQPSRRQKSDDSSDDAEGVAPRLLSLPDDDEQETKKPSAVNMTQCFFLEYDDDDKKRRDPPRLVIDVVQILPIPVGDIAFNQRSLNPTIVASIEAAIDASTRPRSEDDPAPWDPPELVLAPITPSMDEKSQGIRVLPQDFNPDRADGYFYYPVAGQHTSEAMKRAVAKKSATVEVFGFRNYDRVRIIYFDDDHTNGHVYVSTYDNTRADRAMLPSFHQACKDIKGFWDSKKRIGPVGNGKKEVFHCIPARDGGPNATVSFKDLVPSNFKCFIDMTTREKEIALRLMINKKVIATTRLVPPWKLNMANLLDIIMRERYMMHLFNYIVFKSENREAREWKDGNFFDYEKVEQRFGVRAAEWDEERDRIPLEYVRRVPKRLSGEQEEKCLKGAGLKATEALYRDAPFHFKYFVYHAIGRVELLTAELRRLKNTVLNLSWEKKQRQSLLLPVNMHPKELLPAADEIVTAAINLNCKAAILDLANPKECLAWLPTDFDASHKTMTKLCGQPKSPFEHDYIVRKAMAHEAYGGYDKAQVGAFAMFVARCEQMKFAANQAMLMYEEYINIAKTTDAWNPIESDEETETSNLEIEERVKRLREGMQSVSACSVPNENPEEGRTKSGGESSPTHDVTDRASSVSERSYFIEDKVPETTSEKWGHHILWHTDVFEPCIFKGEWMMALHLTSGWKVKPRVAEVLWLKVTKSEIVIRVRRENDGTDEANIEEKAQLIFNSLHSNNRLEYKHKFYDLSSSRSYKTVNWKIELHPACQDIETFQLGCSQLRGQSTTHLAASVGKAMSQTNVKIMGVDKGTRNVEKDPSNVASYGPPLITQVKNKSASQMESPTSSTNMTVSDGMQQVGMQNVRVRCKKIPMR